MKCNVRLGSLYWHQNPSLSWPASGFEAKHCCGAGAMGWVRSWQLCAVPEPSASLFFELNGRLLLSPITFLIPVFRILSRLVLLTALLAHRISHVVICIQEASSGSGVTLMRGCGNEGGSY